MTKLVPLVSARGTSRRSRHVLPVALALGIVVLCLLVGTGLGTGQPHGAGDNGDGVRLYCGAGIVPTTPDRQANWKGVVVDTFRTGGPSCARPTPSSALLPLLATSRTGPTWNLRTLGWTWVIVLGGVLGVAAVAAGATRPWRSLLVVPVAIPLASPVFSRFFLSTYGEPAGLAGTAIALAGTVAAVAAPPRGAARSVGLTVALAGGVLAATAKPAYAVVLLPVLVLCVAVPPAGSRLLGLVTAVTVAIATAVPVIAAVRVQDEEYGPVNSHDLVFTAVGPDSGGDALVRLGLPPSAHRALGAAYYPDGGASVPDWRTVVGAAWPRLRAAALEYVVTHPRTGVAMVDGALRATSDPTLGYLPRDLGSVPGTRPVPPPSPPVGEQGAHRSTLDPWLASRPLGFLPWLLIGTAVGLGVLVTIRRRRTPARPLTALALVATATMALAAVAAVAGDGFFEIAKHTWLASYAASVAVAALVIAGVVRIVGTRPWTNGWSRRETDSRDLDSAAENGPQDAATTAGSRR